MADQEDGSLFHHIASNWELELSGTTRIPKLCMWERPPIHMWALSCDGLLTQNRAGYRGLIRDHLGVLVVAFAGEIGHNNILLLKIYALFRALLLAIDKGCSHVWISLGSKIAVDVLNRDVHCPWQVLCLAYKIWKLGTKFEVFEIHHVRREANQPADFFSS